MNGLKNDRCLAPASGCRRARWIVWQACCLTAMLMCQSVATAQSAARQPTTAAEQQIREALGETSWYDPDADQLIPLRVETSRDDSVHRDSRWLPKPERLREKPATSSGTNNRSSRSTIGDFFTFLGDVFSSANFFAWIVLILLFVILVALLVYAYSRIDQQPDFALQKKRAGLDDWDEEKLAERMEQLPEELRQQSMDPRGGAEYWMRQGRFDRAIIMLFAHQLLLLDRRQLIRLSRGKTNRQYLGELRPHAEPRSILQETVAAFELSYFGRHPLSAERFATLWTENQRLEEILAQHHEAVA